MINLITSETNPKIKHVKALLEHKKTRLLSHEFVLEHVKAIKEICWKNPEAINYLVIENDSPEKDYFTALDFFICAVDTKIFRKLSSLKTSRGVLAVVKKPEYTLAEVLPQAKNLVLLAGISDPSNLGAIIRNAVAFKIDAVLYFEGTVDPYHPEAIQASAGNICQIPIIKITLEDLSLLKISGYAFYTLDAHEGTKLRETEFDSKNLFVFGAEGTGLKGYETYFQESHKIMIETDKVESLNVAVSSGILFYFLSNT